VDYYQIIQQAEDAACSVRDPQLKAIAFDRILNSLLPGQRNRVQISVRKSPNMRPADAPKPHP
jgi:hypothetical protein